MFFNPWDNSLISTPDPYVLGCIWGIASLGYILAIASLGFSFCFLRHLCSARAQTQPSEEELLLTGPTSIYGAV